MNIRVASKGIGECIIKSDSELQTPEEYTIKALCMLQLTCMNSQEDPVKFRELLQILNEALIKADKLYNGSKNESDHILEQF